MDEQDRTQNGIARRLYAEAGKPNGDSERGFLDWAAENAAAIQNERERLRLARSRAIEGDPRIARPR